MSESLLTTDGEVRIGPFLDRWPELPPWWGRHVFPDSDGRPMADNETTIETGRRFPRTEVPNGRPHGPKPKRARAETEAARADAETARADAGATRAEAEAARADRLAAEFELLRRRSIDP